MERGVLVRAPLFFCVAIPSHGVISHRNIIYLYFVNRNSALGLVYMLYFCNVGIKQTFGCFQILYQNMIKPLKPVDV